METTQLILQGLILLGIIYVAFIQERVTKVKDSLWGTLKDYPDIAERRFTWKEEEIKREAEQKIIEAVAKLDSQIKKGEKSFDKTSESFSAVLRVLAAIYVRFLIKNSKHYLVFQDAIEQAKDKNVKEILCDSLDHVQNKIKEYRKEH